LISVAVAAGIACIGVGVNAGGRDWQGRKLPDTPVNFIIGYGSLINAVSRGSTAGATIPAIPVRVAAAFGYIRSWNSRADAFTALGLRSPHPGESAITINGVLYPVKDAELQEYDGREKNYRRVEVPLSQIEAVSWQRLPETGHLWIYVPRDPGTQGTAVDGSAAADADHPLLQSYIDVVIEGGLEYGDDFAKEIIETSDGWSGFWLNDRELARRPLQVLDPRAAKVDELLKKTLTPAQFSARVFPEMYSDIVRAAAAKQP
jgi:hypothetical protein